MALEDAIQEMDQVIKGLTDETPTPTPDTIEVDREGFVRHVTKHFAALKKDTAEVKTARIAYLDECLAIAKNFEGSTPGAIKLSVFKAPEQLKTTETTINPSTRKTDATTHGSATPPTGVPPKAPSGTLVPGAAPPSGAPFANAGDFAKALDTVASQIDEMRKHVEPPKEETPAAETGAEGEGEETPATASEGESEGESASTASEGEGESEDKEPTEKAAPLFDDVFPLDLAEEDEKIDEDVFFGFDKGSKLQKRYEARKSADTGE